MWRLIPSRKCVKFDAFNRDYYFDHVQYHCRRNEEELPALTKEGPPVLPENRPLGSSFVDENGDADSEMLVSPERWKTHHSMRYLATSLLCILIALAQPVGVWAQAENAFITTSSTPLVQEQPFMHENLDAMQRMMSSMDVKPTGDVDRDFVAMMAAHHQGAIDMAQSLLVYGKNERLKRIAQEIIVTQQEEIRAMHLAIGDKASIDDAHPVDEKPPIGH